MISLLDKRTDIINILIINDNGKMNFDGSNTEMSKIILEIENILFRRNYLNELLIMF